MKSTSIPKAGLKGQEVDAPVTLVKDRCVVGN